MNTHAFVIGALAVVWNFSGSEQAARGRNLHLSKAVYLHVRARFRLFAKDLKGTAYGAFVLKAVDPAGQCMYVEDAPHRGGGECSISHGL
jgi:hypothetical protein